MKVSPFAISTTACRDVQWQGSFEDLVADAVLQHVGSRDVDGEVEEFCDFMPEADEVEKGPPGLQLDEKVNVASQVSLSLNHRAKYPGVGNSALVSCSENGTPLVLQ